MSVNTNEERKQADNKIKKIISEHQIFFAISTSIIATLIINSVTYVFGYVSFFKDLPKQINTIEENITTLSENIGDIELEEKFEDIDVILSTHSNQISKIDSLEESIGDIEESIKKLGDQLFTVATLIPTSNVVSAINTMYASVETESFNDSTLWRNFDDIALNKLTYEKYNAEQLAGQPLLFPYRNGNQEILFYGQFNENNQWEGNCIINIYENDNLVSITEANYETGIVKNYKQVISFTTKSGINVWSISERVNEGTFNSGDSWTYVKNGGYKKNFDLDNALIGNVINVETFKKLACSQLEGYYHGNSSNGYYNDSTGNAYMIKYANNGTVRTLYVGNFKDGYYNDNTGNAWYITKDEDTEYMYYNGFFSSGNALNNKEAIFENPISKKCLRLKGSNFRLGGIAPITRAVPSF